MEPKTFDDLDSMEDWARENPDKVSRHLLKAWREVIGGDKENVTVISCSDDHYFEDMNIVVEKGDEEEALETLLQESIDREDYELAREITTLQDKIK